MIIDAPMRTRKWTIIWWITSLSSRGSVAVIVAVVVAAGSTSATGGIGSVWSTICCMRFEIQRTRHLVLITDLLLLLLLLPLLRYHPPLRINRMVIGDRMCLFRSLFFSLSHSLTSSIQSPMLLISFQFSVVFFYYSLAWLLYVKGVAVNNKSFRCAFLSRGVGEKVGQNKK